MKKPTHTLYLERTAFDENETHRKAIDHGYGSFNHDGHKIFEFGANLESSRTEPIRQAAAKVIEFVEKAGTTHDPGNCKWEYAAGYGQAMKDIREWFYQPLTDLRKLLEGKG